MDELLEKITLKPGQKMVFGRVVNAKKGGKMTPKASWKSQRKSRRKQAAKRSEAGYLRDVERQKAHMKARGVKKVRGSKVAEAMYDLLDMYA